MGTCISLFLKQLDVVFSALYQLIRSLVKPKQLLRRMTMSRVAVLLVFMAAFFSLEPALGLTPEEIAHLKEAGVSDETIQLMIQQEKERDRQSRTGIWEEKDAHGNRSTVYRAGDGSSSLERERVEQEKADRAWEILERIVVDTRQKR
jgi:hypothetical protein